MTLETGENPFDLQDEIFFICYDEIIRSPYPFLLDRLIHEKPLRDAYSQFVDVSGIEKFNIDNLLTFCFQREHPNVLNELAIRNFDADGALAELMTRYPQTYMTAELLTIGVSMQAFLKEKTVKTIYIYTPVYDKRVEFDIFNHYKADSKIKYVYGDINELYEMLPDKPTAYFINNIDMIFDMVKTPEMLNFAHLLVADYRYNYVLDDDNVLDFRFEIGAVIGEEINCKFATFSPFTLEPKHVTDFASLYNISMEELNETNNLSD